MGWGPRGPGSGVLGWPWRGEDGLLPSTSALGKGRDRGVQQREGCGTAAGGPYTAQSSPPPHHLLTCLGPHFPSHTYRHASPSIYVPAHPPRLSFSNTHASFPYGLAPLHTPRTHSNAKPESRGVVLGWTKLTSLQMGSFSWVSFEACQVKLWGRCHWVEWGSACNWDFCGETGDLELQDSRWREGQEC